MLSPPYQCSEQFRALRTCGYVNARTPTKKRIGLVYRNISKPRIQPNWFSIACKIKQPLIDQPRSSMGDRMTLMDQSCLWRGSPECPKARLPGSKRKETALGGRPPAQGMHS